MSRKQRCPVMLMQNGRAANPCPEDAALEASPIHRLAWPLLLLHYALHGCCCCANVPGTPRPATGTLYQGPGTWYTGPVASCQVAHAWNPATGAKYLVPRARHLWEPGTRYSRPGKWIIFETLFGTQSKWGEGEGAQPESFGNQPDHTQESHDLSLGMPKRGGGRVQPGHLATSLITHGGHMTYSPGCRKKGGREGVREASTIHRIS